MTAELPPEDWLPVWVDCRGPCPVVEWCDLRGCRFSDPFFDRTVEATLTQPFHQLFRLRTTTDVLESRAGEAACARPSGLIFHMGRCGSTLVAQLLASMPATVVLSEAQPIDAILRAEVAGLDDDRRIAWLRGMVSALSRAGPKGAPLVLKFHAWNSTAIPLVLRAFLNVPWIFVVREPVEVLVSMLLRPAIPMVPGVIEPGLRSLFSADRLPMLPAESMARLVGDWCRSADAALATEPCLVVDHTDLPELVWDLLVERFGLGASAADVERMRTAAEFDAKRPDRRYRADSAAKQHLAGDDVRVLAERYIAPHYGRLRANRVRAEQSHV